MTIDPPTSTIDRFQGRYRFLSNFYPATVTLDSLQYPTVEHAYQAAKTHDPIQRAFIRISCATAGQAKRAGRTVTLRDNWESIKLTTMLDLLRQKFSTEPLRSWLKDTNGFDLVESNDWGDRYWGVCRGSGENWLGKLLMIVRKDL